MGPLLRWRVKVEMDSNARDTVVGAPPLRPCR